MYELSGTEIDAVSGGYGRRPVVVRDSFNDNSINVYQRNKATQVAVNKSDDHGDNQSISQSGTQSNSVSF